MLWGLRSQRRVENHAYSVALFATLHFVRMAVNEYLANELVVAMTPWVIILLNG